MSNVVLFAPLGASLALLKKGARFASSLGALVSLLVELSQSFGFPPSRSPALADILANTAGTVLGWAAIQKGPSLFVADSRRSWKLATGWGVLSLTTTVLTAIGLHRGLRDSAPSIVSVSAIEYAPGFGWYGGKSIYARISTAGSTRSWTLSNSSSGPVVAQTDAPSDEWKIRLDVRGRDPANYQRAMLFLHLSTDSFPELLIAQHDRGVDLQIRRQATDFGFVFPKISLDDVFADSATDDAVSIEVAASAQSILMLTHRGDRHRVTHVNLSPVIGWSMLQTVVGVEDALAPIVQVVWIVVLFGPFGWWIGRTGLKYALVIGSLGLAVVVFGVAELTRVSSIALGDIALSYLTFFLGVAAGRASLAWYPHSSAK